MNHAISTHLFANHRLTTATLERIHNAGIPAVEIFCALQHLDYTNRAQVTELGHWFRDSDLTLHSVHAPMFTDDVWGRSGPNAVLDITELVKAKRILMVDEIKRAIELAETVPFRYLIQHVGTAGEEYSERRLDSAYSSLDELNVFAKQRGVEILLENIPNGLSTAERLVQFLTETHLPLNFCFDTGHAHMSGGIAPAFELMKSRIRSTHVHDNDGRNDKHLWPMAGDGGSVDWKTTMALLRTLNGKTPLLLELKENPERKHPLDDVREILDRLENQ